MRAVINSAVTENFILERLMKRYNLLIQFKINSYKLIAINKINVIIMNEKINKET